MAPVLGSGGHGDHPQHIRPQDVYPGNLLQHVKENNEYYPRCCLLLSKIQNLEKRYWKSFFKTFNLFFVDFTHTLANLSHKPKDGKSEIFGISFFAT